LTIGSHYRMSCYLTMQVQRKKKKKKRIMWCQNLQQQ
ncbi:hypothetical protein T08_14146, partial [Trichinella sp. T8]